MQVEYLSRHDKLLHIGQKELNADFWAQLAPDYPEGFPFDVELRESTYPFQVHADEGKSMMFISDLVCVI